MTYLVALLATRWGSELGGLNVFNTGLATAMPSVLTKHSRTICFVEGNPAGGWRSSGQLHLQPLVRDPSKLAGQLLAVCHELQPKSLQGVLIVGHDVITGPLAIACVEALKRELGDNVRAESAVISHMDYWEYSRKKGTKLDEVTRRHEEQKTVVLAADHAYAVGPLLTANFSSARDGQPGRSSPVRRLIPGAAEISPRPLNMRDSLHFFISGRLNHADDPIKNGILSVHALVEAFKARRDAHDPKWTGRGRLMAYGVDMQEDRDLVAQLQGLASQQARFDIEAVPFSGDQASMHDHLADCHLALMPSWHEGFGLSGWEALCAGVPLICSHQSGLARFLEELKATRPEMPLESVVFVNLGGADQTGAPSTRDVQTLRDAIVETISDLPRRKESAIKLARALKADFTWARCARDLLDSVDGWYLPGSVHWSARQRFANEALSNARKPEQREEVLERVQERLTSLTIADDWQDLTTAFNFLSDLGENAKRIKRGEYRRQLEEIGSAVSALVKVPEDLPPVRDSGLLDVCWRYMAACSAIADDFNDFVGLFSEDLLETIWRDSFLAREMLYYAKPFAAEFDQNGAGIASTFFSRLHDAVVVHPTVAQRLARLASTAPTYLKLAQGIDQDPSYAQEASRCEAAKHSAHDVALQVAKEPSLVATVLAQMAFGPELSRQVADQARAFIKAYYPETDRVEGHWRGDKRLNAALATANLPSNAVLPALRSMASDEDESIRWAALHLAFSPILRCRLEASHRAGALDAKVPLNQALGRVVDVAVAFDGGHPWLCREFLLHFRREYQIDNERSGRSEASRFTLLDFPVSRWLFGPVIGERPPVLNGAQHPEVRFAREAALDSIRRVLLVLPPIEVISADAVAASSTSTPPLGLGLLATHLASRGHDVQIADCHRFPELGARVVGLSSTFDLIGFNAVFTTIKPTVVMLTEIRSRSGRAILVVGGPAAKLHSWKQAVGNEANAATSWDFVISDQAEENLTLLVDSLQSDGPWPDAIGMEANRQSSMLKHRDLARAQNSRLVPARQRDWKEISIDRRVFRANGAQYEPSRTRSLTQKVYQAHVVMSQGCDWNCVFCTERSSVSGGERRRLVDNVLSEVSGLARDYERLNVQFIDDNLLPQIATYTASEVDRRAAALKWAAALLDGLASICAGGNASFGWRGIFRLEDFFAYESAFGQQKFYELLSRSGCRMIAFGIEQGDEQQRARIKAGSTVISNAQITTLLERLRHADILTKAYFILGGQWESHDSALKTINFAIDSGVTLAYFALYKDFTRAAHTLSRTRAKGDKSGEEFLDYRQLAMNWDAAFGAGAAAGLGGGATGAIVSPATAGELACYAELAALGFSFFDVVKYNDFHSDEGASGALLKAVTWSSPADYFAMVEQAYRRFYLRPQFVANYQALLSHGY